MSGLRYSVLLMIGAGLLLSSCGEEQEEMDIPTTELSYEEVAPVLVSPVLDFNVPEEAQSPQSLEVADGRIYMSDRPGQPGRPTLYVLNADDGETIGYMGQRRHGPGDLVSISILGSRPGMQPRISAFDPSQMIISFLDSEAPEDDLRSGARMAELELNDVPDGLALLDDGSIWASGVWSEPYRVIELSGEGGFRQRIIPPPGYEFGRSPRVFNEVWHSVMAAGGDPEIVALAARYAARIDIFTPDAEPVRAILGPDAPEPDFRFADDDRSEFEFTSEARYGYLDVAVHDDVITGLYSGKNHRRDEGVYGGYIHMFDLDGNPLSVIELEDEIRVISIDGANNLIYGLTEEERIVAYSIDEEIS